MKPQYVVRIEEGTVLVEHRAKLRWQTALLFTLGYMYLCFMSGLSSEFRRPLPEFFAYLGVLLLVYTPMAVLLSAFPLYARAEVFNCDKNELRLARRRLFRRWTRLNLQTAAVTELRLTYHVGRSRRDYSVLTFQCGGVRYEALEHICDEDAQRVLAGSAALGAALFVEKNDTVSDAMRRDIAERGWWTKPWRQD